MKRFWILTKSLFLSYVREPQTFFWNLAFPVFLLVIYRLVFGGGTVDGVDYMTWVVPGVVVLNILSFGMIGSSAFMAQMREKGVLRRLQATPIPPHDLFIAYVIVNLIVCLMQTAVVMGFSLVVFQWHTTPAGLLMSLPMIVIAVIAGLAMGQCISSLAPKPGAAMAIGQLFYFPQMFIAGLVLPFEMLPAWLQGVAQWLPAYPIADIVRTPLVAGQLSEDLLRNLILIAAYTFIAGLLATRFFRWEEKLQ
jgi:ABC-2 type transport system permease protein